MLGYTPRYLPTLIIASVLLVSSVTTMLLRCYVRHSLVRSFRKDDWFMVVSTILFMGYISVAFIGDSVGIGRHRYELTDDQAMHVYKTWWCGYLTYGTTITVARVSVGLFFLRVTVVKYHRWAIYFTIFFNILAGVLYVIITAFECLPVSYYWNKAYPGTTGHCIGNKAFIGLGYCYGAIGAFCDGIFVVLPAIMVWNVDIPWTKKFALAPLLGMTGIAGCCPLVRMAYMYVLGSPDFTYDITQLAIWSTLECGLVITTCNLATLRPLLRQWPSTLKFNSQSYAMSSIPDGPEGDAEAERRMRRLMRNPLESSATQDEEYQAWAASRMNKGGAVNATRALSPTQSVSAYEVRFDMDARMDVERGIGLSVEEREEEEQELRSLAEKRASSRLT